MQTTQKYKWHKIADRENELIFKANNLLEVQVAGKNICISKSSKGLHACAAKCPHAGGTIADGFLDASGNIVCPVHRYKFDIITGRNISGEGYFLKKFPIQINEEGVFIGIPESAFYSWLK